IDRTQEVCLSQPICPPAAAGNPFGYVLPRVPETTPTAALFPTVQNVVYRGFGDGHVHRLWRIPRLSGHDDLNATARPLTPRDGPPPDAVGDPKAYVFAAQGRQNVVYRGKDNNVHRLFWEIDPPAVHEDLTVHASVFDPNRVPPPAIGNPFGYVIPYEGVQNVLYRGNDGSLHGLWWSGVAGDVHNDLVTTSSTSDPIGYVAITQRQQNAIYLAGARPTNLFRAFWSTGAASYENLSR